MITRGQVGTLCSATSPYYCTLIQKINIKYKNNLNIMDSVNVIPYQHNNDQNHENNLMFGLQGENRLILIKLR